jgi:hypothetical protein
MRPIVGYALPSALAWTSALAATAAGGPAPGTCCPVLELRQYTLKPGQRDVLIDVFEEHFVESQEALGMRIAGTFRDVSRPDRFVWLRGFDDMESRRVGLEAFYSGPLWKAHSKDANATMISVDDVLLLRPAGEATGLALPATRAGQADAAPPARVIVATIHLFAGPVPADFPAWFQAEAVPLLARAGTPAIGQYVTEAAANTFPRLPVREGENVFVWLAAYPDVASASAALDRLPGWRERIEPRLRASTKEMPQRVVLEPTRRSLLR